MESDYENISMNDIKEGANLLSSEKPNKKNEFSLSNPIFTEMINFNLLKNDIEYELQISFKTHKWQIKRKLSDIKNLVKSLQKLNYAFINSETYFRNIDTYNIGSTSSDSLRDVNTLVLNFLRYINYRYDLLSNLITKEFFSFGEHSVEISQILKNENLEQIFHFKLEENDMSVSDFAYDPETGLLVISMEDLSLLSRLGRFWSLVDYEILGNCFVFQRVFDTSNKPYFKKIMSKSFDSRVSKVELSQAQNKLYAGLDNGSVQIFNINIIKQKEEKIYTILEGNNFKFLIDRVTGMCAYLESFLFITSKENKLLIVDISQSIPECRFNGSLKKRIEGKGHITGLFIDKATKKLYVLTYTNKILIYDIITYNKFNNQLEDTVLDIKIEYLADINCEKNLKNVFIKNSSIFIGLENRIQILIFNTKSNQLEDPIGNIIPLDGSLQEGISYSSKFVKINYSFHILTISYFSDMKLIILGLSNGVLLAFSSRSIEVIFAKKLSDSGINKLILLEENYILIASDEKGNIFFFKLGQ
jgi:hypothetical protein